MAAKQQHSSTQSNCCLVNTMVLLLLYISLSNLRLSALFFFSFFFFWLKDGDFFVSHLISILGCLYSFPTNVSAFSVLHLSSVSFQEINTFPYFFFKVCWFEIMQKPYSNQLYRILMCASSTIICREVSTNCDNDFRFFITLKHVLFIKLHNGMLSWQQKKSLCRVDDSSIR